MTSLISLTRKTNKVNETNVKWRDSVARLTGLRNDKKLAEEKLKKGY